MRKLAIVPVLLGLSLACEETNLCDDYADYMCACHADDEGFDCAELRATLAGADPATQDQCLIDLEDQQAEDEADGLDCAV